MSTNHRLVEADAKQNIYRLKTYQGVEYHVLGVDTYDALEKFKSHPMHEARLMSVVFVGKVDL